MYVLELALYYGFFLKNVAKFRDVPVLDFAFNMLEFALELEHFGSFYVQWFTPRFLQQLDKVGVLQPELFKSEWLVSRSA